MVRAAEQQQGRRSAVRACELPSHGAYFTHAKYRQLHLAAVVARAHEAPRPVVPLRRHRGFGRYPASSLPTTAPTKCLRPLDPLVSFPVAPEATRGQPIAVLHLTEKPSWVFGTAVSRWVPFHFFLPSGGADPAPSIPVRIILGTHLGHEGHFWPPPCRGAANVRAGTGPGPRFGHRVPKSAPTGWAIPPDPQQARGGQIPVR